MNREDAKSAKGTQRRDIFFAFAFLAILAVQTSDFGP